MTIGDALPEDDNLTAALDFSHTPNDDEQSGVGALDEYTPVGTQETDDSEGPLITVANPPGTVTVTTYLNGCVEHVGLSRTATEMTEAELAQEIIVVAAVAAVKAQATLHGFVSGLMRVQGMDGASASDFVERQLTLPTPQQAAMVEAKFIASYADDSK